MFKQSNAFFGAIIEGIGRLLAPHRMFWISLFAVWVAAVFVLRLMGLAPDWLFNLWIWTIPFFGMFAFVAFLGHTGYFEAKGHRERTERLERERAEAQFNRETEEERLRAGDKTRADRR